MSTVEVRDDGLTVRLTRVERLMTLRRADVDVPRTCILRCFSVEDPWRVVRGLRMPGLGVPGRVALGTWRWRGEQGSGRDFLVVRGHGPGVVLDLADHEFDRVVLSIDNPWEITGPLGQPA